MYSVQYKVTASAINTIDLNLIYMAEQIVGLFIQWQRGLFNFFFFFSFLLRPNKF